MLYIGFNPREIVPFGKVFLLERSSSRGVSPRDVKKLLEEKYHSCCNMNHTPVLDVIRHRFDLHIPVAFTESVYDLKSGDKVLIILVSNIRFLFPGERYTYEELRKSRIFFRLYSI